jgi:hypothetical protein
MATKYAGKQGLVYASIDGVAAPILVGACREFTIDLTTDKIDVTEFGAVNKTAVLGFPAARGTIAGFWASDDTTLRQAAGSVGGTIIALYPTSTLMTKFFGGPAWLDMSLREAVDTAVTTTFNWEARGSMVNNL